MLVVDDSSTFREYLRVGLEAAGYCVLSAENGEEGLSIAQNRDVDAFVVDHVLPGIDGASVVRRLRQQVRHRRTPSLLLTASDDPAQELKALEAGADAFVRKDEEIDVLLARLASILRSVGTPLEGEDARREGRAPRVLFIDAHAHLLDHVARSLEKEGVVVQMASSAELPSGDFDCIVAYVGTVGTESPLVMRLRKREESHAARLVLLGESDSRTELVEAIALGADDYLPVTTGEAVMVARLHAQLRRKQLEDENETTRENLVRHRMELTHQQQLAAARAAVAEELRIARDLAEDKAREAENLLAQNEAIFRSMAEGLIISDLEGRLLQVNPAALQIFGAGHARELEEMLHPESSLGEFRYPGGESISVAEWPLAQACRGTSVNNLELEFVRRDKEFRFTGSFNAVSVEDRESRRILAALTFRDITAQKRSEEVLRRTEQLAVTGRLAASIAHEINNPLSAVMNLLYLLESRVENNRPAGELVASAQKELRRVADITRQTLAFYRDSTRPVEVDVCALVAEVAEVFSAKLHAAEVRLQLELECAARPCAYPGELRQAISNIVSNAIDASPRGEVVRIRVRACRIKDLPGVRISVADRGPGIPRSFYPEVFKPFSSLKALHGTGLGLWVTHSIVARHEGCVRFHSRTQEPSGTAFSIFVPIAPGTEGNRPDNFSKLFRELGRELLAQNSGHR